MRYLKLITTVAVIALTPAKSLAQESISHSITEKSSKPFFVKLNERMKQNPKDLDAFFKYAQLSYKSGQYRSAEKAYLHMLEINPNLNRVKVELASVYINMDNKNKARILLVEVLNDAPPPMVKKEIEERLKSLNNPKSEIFTNKSKSRKTNNSKRARQIIKRLSNKPQKNMSQKQFRNEIKKRTKPENRPRNIIKKEDEKQKDIAKLPDDIQKAMQELEALEIRVRRTPENLDGYFALAKMAEKLNQLEKAEEAYLHMLEKQPSLNRVKLDLGLLYLKMAEFKKSKSIFEGVLKQNPPDKVKENINNLLARIEQAQRKHIISGSVSFGLNRDSNATSAASTGETTFSDISIPLAENSTKKEDAQIFATTSLSHIYKFNNSNSKLWSATFNSTGTLYKTRQGTESQLDIGLASLKAGPTLNLNKLKTQIGIAGSISIINLDSFKYLKTRSGELTLKYAPTNKLILDNTSSYEYRYFYNSPTATNTGRTGNAYQNKIGATYVLTEKDILTSSLTWRNESAREARYAYDQINLALGYTRQLPYDIVANAAATFKRTHYDDFDTSISSTILRRDLEKTFTLTLLKKLPKNISLTTSYQYKNSNSNIQNYTYDNHKLTGAIGWSF